jgi:hypothetical protein
VPCLLFFDVSLSWHEVSFLIAQAFLMQRLWVCCG